MSSEIAIKVESLSKCYRIYDQPLDRLKQFILPRIQHLVGFQRNEYFHEFWALRGISFELKRGASLGILGLNGAGKSTLLQIICGTVAPSSGSIEVNGRIAALLELGAGFNPEFTGIENIYLNGKILGLSDLKITEKLDQILAFADIGEFVHQPIKTYSSGMYVRLAFAIAIHSDPDILVIDEALSVGDFIFQQKCNLFLKEKLSDATKIFVSHDIGVVANMTDTALVLNEGELLFHGDVQSAIQEYQRSSRAIRNLDTKSGKNTSFFGVGGGVKASSHAENPAEHKWHKVPLSLLSGVMDSLIYEYSWMVSGKSNIAQIRPGDIISISFSIRAIVELRNPIVGYQVQDRFGVVVFGQNNIDSLINIKNIAVGVSIIELNIIWPEISNGKYSMTVGIGKGEDSEVHEILCWAHNFIVLESMSKRPVHGIFNNQINDIKISRYG